MCKNIILHKKTMKKAFYKFIGILKTALIIWVLTNEFITLSGKFFAKMYSIKSWHALISQDRDKNGKNGKNLF